MDELKCNTSLQDWITCVANSWKTVTVGGIVSAQRTLRTRATLTEYADAVWFLMVTETWRSKIS